ncbi:hypothetical protein [Burkholderia gladioli]|uniref:hypothetical protein n=1 Tax=Burkholderia gladioli TaxID=28095 RepID=UPI000F5271DA|nr:hypothetical protein [Burkholderia gladioli]
MSHLPQPAAESMHTVCVGRYTIDLPKSAADLQIGQKINGIQIDVQYPANSELQQHKVAEDARANTDKAPSKLTSLPANAPETSIFQISDDTQNLHTVRGYLLKKDILYSFNVQVLSDSVAGAKIANRKGDEYDLIDKSSKAASFEWAAMPEEDGAHEPGIDATLFSNGAVQDEKIGSLLGTWDVILHSLKRR